MKLYDPNDPEQRVAMHRRNENIASWDAFGKLTLCLVVLALIFAATLAGNQWWYGDWRCAFVNCVRAQDIKAVKP